HKEAAPESPGRTNSRNTRNGIRAFLGGGGGGGCKKKFTKKIKKYKKILDFFLIFSQCRQVKKITGEFSFVFGINSAKLKMIRFGIS
ncbi:MAG: hypothetical protein LBG22_04610, partial [Treponema sp.]|nr:hypothetical protein [Treponema sp.]